MNSIHAVASQLQRRKRSGNVMILIAAITLGIIIAVILFALDYNQFLGASHQHLTAVESAGLAAAQDISRIVVRDPNYGYIALTDYPPVGRATVAPDGRPVPVTGINTIIGTARMDLLLAHAIGNRTMLAMAERDYNNAMAASRLLTDCLKNALAQPEGGPTGQAQIAGDGGTDPRSGPWTDMDGQIVNPYADAKGVYMANLTSMSNHGRPIVNSFRCTLGYLDTGGSTLTQIPRPEQLSQVQSNQRQGDFYKAFINIPAHGHDFYFAGLSSQPALIDARQFKPDDNSRICSAVRVEAEHSFERKESTTEQVFKTIACAEPSGTPDTVPGGVMTIAFPDGLPTGNSVSTIRDLLTSGDLGRAVSNIAEARNGDYPLDPPATLIGGIPLLTPGGSTSPSPTEMFAGGMFDWLRSNRTRPNIASVTAFLGLNIRNTLSSGAVGALPQKFDLMQPAIASPETNPETIYTGIMQQSTADRWATLLSRTPEGLAAYEAIANYQPVSTTMPANAAEVRVASDGTITSSSGDTINAQKIGEFWTAVHNTQSAAYQTLATAQVAKQARGLLPQIENALANSRKAIDETTRMIQNQSEYTSDGFAKREDGTYQFGPGTFYPHPTPPSSVLSLVNETANSGPPSNLGWTASTNDFKVFDLPNDAAGSTTQRTRIRPRLLMVEFDSSGNVVPTAMPSSPFVSLPVSDGQQIGVAFGALRTPGNLSWTVVYRDQTHTWGRGKHMGLPLPGTPVDWCQRATYGFDLSSARAKAKGQDALGIRVASTGAPANLNTDYAERKGSSKASKGSRYKVPLMSMRGPRSARPGTGDPAQDMVGFPWGFKYGDQIAGAKWSVADVKYQFPGGAPELGLGNGNAWGKAKNALNNGTAGLNPVANRGGGEAALGPFGMFATFAPKDGGTLPTQPMASYYCGGLAFDFQIRGPIIEFNPSLATTNGFGVHAGNGQATVDGVPVQLLDTLRNVNVNTTPSTEGVKGLQDQSFTTPLPAARRTL